MDKQALLALVDEHCSKIAGNMESLLETFHSQVHTCILTFISCTKPPQDQAENKVLESRLSTMIHSQNIVHLADISTPTLLICISVQVTSVQTLQSLAADLKNRFIMGL